MLTRLYAQTLRPLFLLTYYQVLIGLRIRQSFFFSLVFPISIFFLFNSLWNVDNEPTVAMFYLSGIVLASCVSEGLYVLSSTFKKYLLSGFMVYLQKMFTLRSAVTYFLGLILSRLLIFLCVLAILSGASICCFGVHDWQFFVRLLAVVPVCTFISSFLGLTLSFTGIRNLENSFNHVVFYFVIFTSDAYYPASRLSVVGRVGDFFPLNNLLTIARLGWEFASFWPLVMWVVVPFVSFHYLFFRLKHRRK